MSLDSVLQRINEIQSMTGTGQVLGSALGTQTTGASASVQPSDNTAFSGTLQSQMISGATPAGGGTVSQKMVRLAQGELAKGVKETPDGSNNSPDIARYRTATQGAAAGEPWCAYFVSYIAKQAGSPIGSHGQGLGYVPDITSWARSAGRFIPSGGNIRPGDLILFDQHVGIVEQVGPGNSVTTIEGNSSNRVARRQHTRSEAVGFVRLG